MNITLVLLIVQLAAESVELARASVALVKRAGLRDRRLTRLAEIVHEADLRDGKFPRDEARGIDLVIRGLLAAHSDDHEVLTHGLALFEGLYVGASRKE